MFNPHLRQVQSGQIPQGLVQSSLQRFHCCSGQHIPVSDLPPGEKNPVFCHVSCLLAFHCAPWKRVWFCFLYILKLSQPFFIYQMAQSLVVLVAFCCTLSNVTVFVFVFFLLFWEVQNPSQVQMQPYERSMPTSLNLLALLELMQNFFFP